MGRNLKLLKAVGDELRRIRNSKKLPIKEVAEHVGVSSMYISEIERNKKTPSDEVVKKLSEIYNVEEMDLFEGFNRIPESMHDEILSNSDLFNLLYELSTNPKITNDEKAKIYKDAYTSYVTMFKN